MAKRMSRTPVSLPKPPTLPGYYSKPTADASFSNESDEEGSYNVDAAEGTGSSDYMSDDNSRDLLCDQLKYNRAFLQNPTRIDDNEYKADSSDNDSADRVRDTAIVGKSCHLKGNSCTLSG